MDWEIETAVSMSEGGFSGFENLLRRVQDVVGLPISLHARGFGKP